MIASKRAYILIKQFESLQLKAYQCPAGLWTIGYGHTATAKPGMVIDKTTAEELLRRDVREVERVLNESVKVPLSQSQFDALVSFVFNVGAGKFLQSTLLKKLNAGDFKGAADEFLRWTKAKQNAEYVELPGLLKRRQAERQLFLESLYATH